jgi:CrcB protein
VTNALWIVAGAAIGSLLRYGFQQLMVLVVGASAVGTVLANSLGCLVAGIAAAFLAGMPDHYRLMLMTGLLGSLTTLSSLQLEILQLIQADRLLTAGIHWCGAALGGLLLCWVGYYFGQKFA